jgi:hypothetical protein
MEFAKLWAGDDDCALPQRVTSISRQGVSYTLLDSQDFIDDLRTGLYAVDLFLKTVNPDKARRKSRVFSPDVPRARRYTPKPLLLTADAEVDLKVIRSTPATWTSVGKEVDVSIFFDEDGYSPVLTLKNYGGTTAIDVASSNITVNEGNSSVSFSIAYETAYRALGVTDPGTWTLYAVRTINNVETIAEVATGNLQIQLYS